MSKILGGTWKTIKEIGQGEFGVVWLSERIADGKIVAI